MKSHQRLLIMGIASLWPWLAYAQRNPDIQLYYDLLNRVEMLEREVRQLRGDLEVMQYRYGGGQSSRRDPSEEPPRVSTRPDPQSALALPPVGYEEPLPGSQGYETPQRSLRLETSASEEEAYSSALDELRGGRYEQAANDFMNFIATYPNSQLTSDAYYWLGESYYVIRDFDQAQQAFLTLGAQYPNSRKVPDTLLKLGYIYSETGDNDKARQVLERLVETYPDSQASSLAQKRLRLLR